MKAGHVLGASEDMTICHWDVNSYTKAKTSIEPTTVFRGHSSVVGVSVDFAHTCTHRHPTLLRMSTGMPAKKMCLQVLETIKCSRCRFSLLTAINSAYWFSSWDLRTPSAATIDIQAHDREILSVAFSLAQEHLLITGSADKVSNGHLCFFLR